MNSKPVIDKILTDAVPDKAGRHPELKSAPQPAPKSVPALPPEFGGPKGPEPTRYGDWEQKGRCSDF